MPRRSHGAARGTGRAASRGPASKETIGDIHRLVADSSPEWEYITDDRIRLIYSSPSCERMTGFTAEQLTADPESFYRIVHPADLPLVLEHDATRAGPSDPSELEFRILHPSEGERWVGHICHPLFDASGRFIGRRGTLRDITKRKEAEQSLQMVRTALDHAGEMAFFVDEDGHPIYVNNSACRALGFTREEFLRLRVREIEGGGITKNWAAYWEAIRKAGTSTFETLARTKDGSSFPVEVTVTHVEFQGRGYHCGFARDISERKAVQEQLREAQVTLEDKVRQRTGALQAANAALRAEIAERRRLEVEVLRIAEWEQRRIGQDLHDDLCQQLAAIAYLCDSVAPQSGPMSLRARTKIRRIGVLLHRALGDARNMARGLSPINLEDRGLRAALKDLATAVRTCSGVHCRLQCDHGLFRDDATRAAHVYRIVQEAVGNAIRHGKARNIKISLRAVRRTLRLSIEDDGKGVPNRPRRSRGMGLGSMQYRAHAMGGSFEIRRRPRGGTAVVCLLPLLLPPRKEAAAPHARRATRRARP
jgi:PAS domain S-box-containing protein